MFKKLREMFSGGGSDDSGIYVYVKLAKKGEIVMLRLEPQHELINDGDGYYSRKTIVGPRTFERAEATFYFNHQRRLMSADISGGELSTEEAYRAQFSDEATSS